MDGTDQNMKGEQHKPLVKPERVQQLFGRAPDAARSNAFTTFSKLSNNYRHMPAVAPARETQPCADIVLDSAAMKRQATTDIVTIKSRLATPKSYTTHWPKNGGVPLLWGMPEPELKIAPEVLWSNDAELAKARANRDAATENTVSGRRAKATMTAIAKKYESNSPHLVTLGESTSAKFPDQDHIHTILTDRLYALLPNAELQRKNNIYALYRQIFDGITMANEVYRGGVHDIRFKCYPEKTGHYALDRKTETLLPSVQVEIEVLKRPIWGDPKWEKLSAKAAAKLLDEGFRSAFEIEHHLNEAEFNAIEAKRVADGFDPAPETDASQHAANKAEENFCKPGLSFPHQLVGGKPTGHRVRISGQTMLDYARSCDTEQSVHGRQSEHGRNFAYGFCTALEQELQPKKGR